MHTTVIKKQTATKRQTITRGDIYYICDPIDKNYVGSEQQAERPAIVVSNNSGNKHSEIIEIVYLTTQPKQKLKTHVPIQTATEPSIALCEQITTVAKERTCAYIGRATKKEMCQINAALIISLGIKLDKLNYEYDC